MVAAIARAYIGPIAYTIFAAYMAVFIAVMIIQHRRLDSRYKEIDQELEELSKEQDRRQDIRYREYEVLGSRERIDDLLEEIRDRRDALQSEAA